MYILYDLWGYFINQGIYPQKFSLIKVRRRDDSLSFDRYVAPKSRWSRLLNIITFLEYFPHNGDHCTFPTPLREVTQIYFTRDIIFIIFTKHTSSVCEYGGRKKNYHRAAKTSSCSLAQFIAMFKLRNPKQWI